jgi:antitoxin CptB
MYSELDQQQRHLFIKKLLYKSKNRGCKETDLILGRFAEKFIDKMNIDELIEFAKILDQNDADIYDWYIAKTSLPSDLNSTTMNKLLNFDINSHIAKIKEA